MNWTKGPRQARHPPHGALRDAAPGELRDAISPQAEELHDRSQMTYAKIAYRTVAEEYFTVSSRIEAFYAPAPVPAVTECPNMRALCAEADTLLLGKGYCTRPAALGCRYETTSQTSTFLATTIEYRDALTAQRDEAKRYGDNHHRNLYDGLSTTLRSRVVDKISCLSSCIC